MKNREVNFLDKAKDFGRRTAIAGLAFLLIVAADVGCAPIEGRDPTSSVISTETTTNPDLKDVAPERLEFTKDLLNLYDESSKSGHPGFDKIKDFIIRDQIIEYGETGETGQNLSIIKHKDGSPAIALVNCNDNVTNGFKDMVNNMSEYDEDFLKIITNNGMVAFMVNRFADEGDTFFFNKSGLMVWNLKDQNTKFLALERPVLTESFGIKMHQIGGDYKKYAGFIKEQLSSDCWWNLYKKNGEYFCKGMSNSSYLIAKDFYGRWYAPEALKDEKIQNLINEARELVSLFGGKKTEILKSIEDRPDWNVDDEF